MPDIDIHNVSIGLVIQDRASADKVCEYRFKGCLHLDLYDELVHKADHRLSQEKFKLWRKVSIAEVSDTDLFASRLQWLVSRNSEHVFVQHKISPTVNDFKQLFDTGLDYAKRAYPVPFHLQLWTNYRLIGCIATTNVRQDVIEWVMERPREYWGKRIIHGYYQLPVLIDLQSEKNYYYQGPFCRPLRKIAAQLLGES